MPSTAAQFVSHTREQLGRVIVGQRDALDLLLVTLLCGGHALLQGVPGLGKTLSVRALARLVGLKASRVQCTPDLMPADIVGTSVLNVATSEFTLRRGPIFTDLLLVDEINRMPPRSQSALLEAMEERQVTIDGASYALSAAFAVFATQNPVEFEGTYPLPEAELDRFLVMIRFGYPDSKEREEEAILSRYQNGFDARALNSLELAPLSADDLAAARREVALLHVEPPLLAYIAAVSRRTREWSTVSLGASPRAAINLLQVAKALAVLEGRGYLLPDDVKRAAVPVLRHRLVLKPEADLEGIDADRVVADVIASVEIPK